MRPKSISYKLLIILSFNFNNLLNIEGQHGAKYWIQFTDKNEVPYSINEPEKFLSTTAIQRRIKNNSPVTEEDLPVNNLYTDSLRKSNVRVMYTSKWFNSVTVEAFSDSVINKIKGYSFVQLIKKTADATINKNYIRSDKNNLVLSPITYQQPSEYGNGYVQIKLEDGIPLHDMGFRGKGVIIAIIDVGFQDADNYVTLAKIRDENRVLNTRNYVNIGKSVYNSESHGAAVFSVIGANLPGTFIGTAPDASFILLCSEDGNSEFPVEEDNWIAAAEYADSLGADIITTSLGYNTFTNPIYDHSYADLNGVTSRMSIAESIAVSKGIVVINSAGNEGDKSWHYISIPADAKNILTIGAVRSDSSKASFSSFGPSSDGRIKPDIMAMGQFVAVEGSAGHYGVASGTSLSSPIIAGLTACLIQAFPNVKADSIQNVIKQSADRYKSPDNSYGYGIPDFYKAYNILKNVPGKPAEFVNVFPNPFGYYLSVNFQNSHPGTITIMCFNTIGSMIFKVEKPAYDHVFLQSELQNLKQGLYIFKCSANNQSWEFKAVKRTN